MNKERQEIIRLLREKSVLKQDIADYSEELLGRFKKVIQQELTELRKEIKDKRIRLSLDDKSKNEFRLSIGSDTLVFQLHTNVFQLPEENPMWKSDYLKNDERNGYFGVINIYNFLAESVERNRLGDIGYLIGRVFINQNEHFMVEGKGQLGFLFRDLENSVISEEVIVQIVHNAISHALDFDLLLPPYDLVKEVNLMQINAISSDLQISTGKRLGFKFMSKNNDIF